MRKFIIKFLNQILMVHIQPLKILLKKLLKKVLIQQLLL